MIVGSVVFTGVVGAEPPVVVLTGIPFWRTTNGVPGSPMKIFPVIFDQDGHEYSSGVGAVFSEAFTTL